MITYDDQYFVYYVRGVEFILNIINSIYAQKKLKLCIRKRLQKLVSINFMLFF